MALKLSDHLTSHQDINFVTFTGSSVIGQHISEICSKNKTPNTLELGGKSPTVILADADLEKVIPLAARSIFMMAVRLVSGQVGFMLKNLYSMSLLHDFQR